MPKVVINDNSLTAVADKIREYTGKTEGIKPEQMAQGINDAVEQGVKDFEEELLNGLY